MKLTDEERRTIIEALKMIAGLKKTLERLLSR